jgi:hypothetical protein
MPLTLRSLVLLVGLCVSALGLANADEAKPTTEMSAADTTKWIGFFDKLVSAVVSTSSAPCDRMATDVNAVIDANKDAIEVARAAHASGRKLPLPAQQRMMEGVKKMVPAMQRCGSDARVRAAFARLDLTRKEPEARR